jgi:phosphoribosylformimino-5-aminoimidazole carboxamide ribotide isomerase
VSAVPTQGTTGWDATTKLTIYPAIDLKDGECVRLRRGDMAQATVYSADPGAQAKAWQDAGFTWLHVVDLNGAFAGKPVNAGAVRAIFDRVSIPVQLGGGIRDMAGIAAWLEAGIHRVILGSAAAKNPPLVIEACKAFPGRIAVGIDARDGFVATDGWAESSAMAAADLGLRFEDAGVTAIIYTDIGRDGMLQGANVAAMREMVEAVPGAKVIASGGVTTVDDIRALRQAGAAAAIVGMALYTGKLDLREAMEAAC